MEKDEIILQNVTVNNLKNVNLALKKNHLITITGVSGSGKSTLINDAYQTLKNPLKRAQYLLELRGVNMPSEQASFGDVSFLMRQMELREMLAEVKHADDVDSAVFEVSQVFESEFQQLFNQLQSQLADNSAESNHLACDNLRKLKFYQKLHVELDKLEEQLLDD